MNSTNNRHVYVQAFVKRATIKAGNFRLHLHIYIYIYSFSRRFYPKRLPRESFTKVHRSDHNNEISPTLQVVKHESYIVKKPKNKCQREKS